MIKFHAVPFTVNVVTVWVVPAVNSIEWAIDPSSLKSANVLLPEIVILQVDAPRANHRLLYANQFHSKDIAVALVLVNFIVLHSQYTVKVQVWNNCHKVQVHWNSQVPVHILKILVQVWELKFEVDKVTLKSLASNSQFINWNQGLHHGVIDKLEPKVNFHQGEFTTKFLVQVFQAVVKILFPLPEKV